MLRTESKRKGLSASSRLPQPSHQPRVSVVQAMAFLIVTESAYINPELLLLLFICQVVSNCLWLHGLWHTKLLCPSLSPGVCSNSCPWSQWCHSTISSSVFLLPSVVPSIRFFSNESVLLIRWPKYWSFSFSISLSSEYSGLISLRIDWFDFFAVQGTLWSLPQHHNLKASILQFSAFFMVQLSHPYMTTGKTIALTRWTFVGKVMSLLFNMLSSFVIGFHPRSKQLLISWLQSPSAVTLESKKIILYCTLKSVLSQMSC